MSELFSTVLFWQGFIVGACFIAGGWASWCLLRSWARRKTIHELLMNGQISVNEARTLLQTNQTLRFYQSREVEEPDVFTTFPPKQ